ncbi:hypothetical protein PILCRDRAFT_348 [Piloderma croceum F 1598]|uniref:Uncharacterized protein n=1 Tax=Piloderma croceum (strain F 1598) TaxID=765440 RepID=A0A0C3CRI4_PILCF|nr:hypothetical protein PILCRDRAFT_348 [Piloderma croceum F 1598]
MASNEQPGVGSDNACLHGVDIVRVGGKYRLREWIGSGSFSIVYCGINVVLKEDVAIKLEPIDAEFLQLDYEHKVYKHLAGGIGIPAIRWFGTEGDYNAMVLQCLGPSLEDLFNYSNRMFSLRTVLLLADQMVCNVYEASCVGLY